MAAQDTEQEPSIEEILSSIRQIISDDDDAPSAPPPPPPKKQALAEEPQAAAESVLELTNKVEDDFASFVQAASVEEPRPIEVEMQEADEDPFYEPEPVAPPPPPPKAAAPKPRPPMDDSDSILTSRAENAALSGFAELARKTSVEYNGITLEEIVRTELKPMLREWLDSHLPSIIERLVQEELERVAKRALED